MESGNMNKEDKYEDIINMPHHRSDHRPHMTMSERAAQFAPFAALSGYGDIIKEAEQEHA